MKKWWWLLALGLLAIIYFRLYARSVIPFTHDGGNHVARFAQYYLALKQGQFPPRLGPTLDNGFGVPVFNYNYPLANILSLPLSVVGFSFETSFKLLVVALVLLGVVSTWQWARLFTSQKTPWLPTLAYWFAPYLWSAIWYRGSIGEVAAYALFPACWWQLELFLARKKNNFLPWGLLACSTGFFLSHNVMVLLLTPLLLLYSFYRWWAFGRAGKLGRQLILTLALALGLSGWFWLPALGEKSLVNLENSSSNQAYQQHFLDLSQLFNLAFHSGLSLPGTVDGLSFGLGLTLSVGLLAAAGLVFARPQKSPWAWSLLLLAVILIFFQTEASASLWAAIPWLKFVQFPWRLSLPLTLVVVGLLAAYPLPTKAVKIFWGLILVGQLWWQLPAGPTQFDHQVPEAYLTYAMSTTTNRENTPRTFTFDLTEKTSNQPEVVSGSGTISAVTRLDTTEKKYQLLCESATCLVIEPTANFAGFQTTLNRERVAYIDSELIQGRIAFRAPSGEYQVRTRFTQNTPARLIGNGLTLFCGLFLVYKATSQAASFSRRASKVK